MGFSGAELSLLVQLSVSSHLLSLLEDVLQRLQALHEQLLRQMKEPQLFPHLSLPQGETQTLQGNKRAGWHQAAQRDAMLLPGHSGDPDYHRELFLALLQHPTLGPLCSEGWKAADVDFSLTPWGFGGSC